MPRGQKELIHYHRLSQKYRFAFVEYKEIANHMLEDMRKTSSRVWSKYDIEIQALEREINRIQVPPPV